MTSPQYLPIGTISENALDPEALLTAYWHAIQQVDASRLRVGVIATLNDGLTLEPHHDRQAIIQEMESHLDALTPPYARFRSLPVHRSLIGVWPDFEAIENDGVPRIDEPSELEILDPSIIYAFHEKESGGFSLYQRDDEARFHMVWDI